jgi:hypothetical protein
VRTFHAEVQRVVPDALLFLPHLESIIVDDQIEGSTECRRVRDGDDVILVSGSVRSSWRVFETDFEDVADELREEFAALIDRDRSAVVRVALSTEQSDSGLLYAGLPTRTRLAHLGIRIDAKFFPTRDRKSVNLENDWRGRWNRAALSAAADLVADEIEAIFDVLGAGPTWELIGAAFTLATEADAGDVDEAFAAFWSSLQRAVPGAAVVPVRGMPAQRPGGTLVAVSPEVQVHASALAELGLHIVDDVARPTLLRIPEVGVSRLSLGDVIDAAVARGLDADWDPDGEEPPARREDAHDLLRVLHALMDRAAVTALELLDTVAIVPCQTGGFATPSEVLRIHDQETRALVTSLRLDVQAVDEILLNELCPGLLTHCRELDAGELIPLLTRDSPFEAAGALEVLEWLNGRRHQISDQLKPEIRALPIFPSTGTLKPLEQLALPGGFEDPLGLANLVDTTQLAGLDDFLTFLGGRPLDLPAYLADFALPRLDSGDVPADLVRALLDIIVVNRSTLEERSDLRDALSDTKLIPCVDHAVRAPREVYFADAGVAEWGLATAEETIGRPAVVETYAWLGVARHARLPDVVERAELLAATSHSTSIDAAGQLLLTLHRHPDTEGWLTRGVADSLKSQAWLPAKDGRKYRSDAVYPTFQEFLFSSQGPFLAIPAAVQREAVETLYWLGMPRDLPPSLVVAHVHECVSRHLDVHPEIYRYLGEQDLTSSQIDELRAIACVQFGPDDFHFPADVFWDESPFGPFSRRLDPALRARAAFFDKLGVKERPDGTDAVRTLTRVAAEWRPEVLDEQQLNVVSACWERVQRRLRESADFEAVVRELAAVLCVPDPRNVLERPEQLFFRDTLGLAARSALLGNSLVDRHADTWEAYEAAGIRHITSALDTSVELVPPVADDSHFAGEVRAKSSAIRRILEAQGGPTAIAGTRALRSLEFQQATTVRVRHELHAFKQVELLEPFDAPFYYDDSEHRLLRKASSERDHLQVAARELGRALGPDLDAGGLASLAGQLLHVLGAASVEVAHELLSGLGLPQLSETGLGDVVEYEAAELGIQSGEEAEALVDWPTTEVDDGEAECTADGELEVGVGLIAQSAAMDLFEGSKQVESQEGPEEEVDEEEALDDEVFSEHNSGTSAGSPRPVRRKPAAAKGSQQRMISYVLHGGADDEQTLGDEAPDRSETDVAGIAAVLEFEISAGRTPTEMPHQHPGYDIESRDERGEVVRRIEVKSTEGAWGVRGVGLSRRQFEESRNEGAAFWLYVVEYATDPARRRIYSVNDPYSAIRTYFFDSGWSALGEDDQ